MRLSDLIPLDGHLDAEITGLTADSRQVKPGFLFAALPGETTDGRRYIDQAIAAGAAAILAPTGTTATVPVLADDNPRQALAMLAARFHAGQPKCIVGVTGTNGKTSVARFVAQLWSAFGHSAGTVGTLGASAPGYDYALRHTTPDPVELHQVISTMAAMGTTHLAMEVSSHGLAQHRADGVRFSHAGFTNITQDHLDYHPSFEAYFAAKMRLLTALLPETGQAVITTDGAGAEGAIEAAQGAGRRVLTVGRRGETLKLLSCVPHQGGLALTVSVEEGPAQSVALSLIGDFQADNALVAAGLVIASGAEPEAVIEAMAKLSAAPGRMQPAGQKSCEGGMASAFVDYAHTPDAIATALRAIKPHVPGGRVVVVIGAGGDRDRTKRPLMGRAAAAGADLVIVTDDNPRSEDPAAIRSQVAEGAPGAQIIGGREAAIRAGAEALKAGDVLLVTGKGHEQTQTIGHVTYPFDDVSTTLAAMGGEG
ncbi:UDP-N-acetylmuramoylalanyl-D-glutamate--2,6-diaminopimelate ligase [Parvularcula bermudensis HTCC2503]|uniref:UDP-N-acetylmuramoyl-L-alanyl-D-glutamate--2,6-diaminopimelate ligase n=1 Tax=Parvularcula bermudensis (strain ATCC BAA-594 / HTCC2503 / KCTC 12087) TaxID=314260 RepID=E0TDS6_PARBH|nr:UDP-N-acetylmuramoyl-L-alanyl-D-glutamate--2,6-diaminopimelate ligase [Parvularcula bermudensis]ADM09992.1 UDP-N-acetylmuramoylalanyl-D-glutamate--2,6-diaminopimelate ligase [Parvularcula bermudensis HTCC2503]